MKEWNKLGMWKRLEWMSGVSIRERGLRREVGCLEYVYDIMYILGAYLRMSPTSQSLSKNLYTIS